jgi:hypothetical protein
MSKCDYARDLKGEDFRLSAGVKKNTFSLMLKYLHEEQKHKKEWKTQQSTCGR